MKSNFGLAVLLISSLTWTGCNSISTTEGVGAVAGGIAGGVIGNKVDKKTGTYVGAAAGALVGYQLAKMLTPKDKESLGKSTQETAATGEPRTWSNPETGVKGGTRVVEPPATTQPVPAAAPERPCRTIEQKIELPDGTTKTETVVLCQNADGQWQVK